MVRGMREIAAEGILIAAGGRAILLQVAHPAVGRGVARHSDFADRPLDRLRATMTYVYAVVYGTAREERAVKRRVGAAHAPVHGDASGDAPAYDAFDPALQLWVAATLYDSAITMYELVFGPLDAASADRIYREYAVLGTALQVPADAWPADRAAFARYWREGLDALRVGPDARGIARDLLEARNAPPWLRALMPAVRRVTVALLPQRARDAYGLRLTPRARKEYGRWLRAVRRIYPRLPLRVRHAPRDALLHALRRSLS